MRKRREDILQRDVCQLLDGVLSGNAVFFAIPNGGKRSPIEAAIMAGLGTKAGIPDLVICDGGRAHFLELKSDKGRLSPAQKAMHAALQRAGCPVAVVRSTEDVQRCLDQWGIPHRIAASSRSIFPQNESIHSG